MKSVLGKVLLASASVLLIQNLSADTTVCYKKAWEAPSTIENTKLDGGECKGDFSLTDMKNKGWNIKDLQIDSAKNGLDYTYVLTDEKIIKIDNEKVQKTNTIKNLSIKPIITQLKNVNETKATINIGNLKIGQSGIISHRYEDGQELIISNAYVVSSNTNSSELKLFPFLDLKQNAIPTSKTKAQKGDTIILNYMYNKSLLIAPSRDAFQVAREKFTSNTFLHSDIFASKLKAMNQPLPTRKTIQEFAISQNLGTVYIIIKNKAFVVDSKTFAVLDAKTLTYNYLDTEKMPFYTRVDNIEESVVKGMWDKIKSFKFVSNIFGDDERSEEERLLEGELDKNDIVSKNKVYNEYYKAILGFKND